VIDFEPKAKEACGLIGVFGHPEAVQMTYLGLYALQHRGQESAGICSTDGSTIKSHRAMGYVGDCFDKPTLKELRNDVAIGHVRYSTKGSSTIDNVQPLLISYSRGQLAVAHNGNLVNADELRNELETMGSIFQTTNDSEVMLHLLAKPSLRFDAPGLSQMLNRIQGAFSLLFLTPDGIVAVRDANGWRPLWLGTVDGAHVLASETCALDLIGAEAVREIEPGEMLWISKDGLESRRFAPHGERAFSHCIFEHIYFARPDSRIFGETVHEVRKRLGALLAEEHPVEADIVISVPDSGNSAALGYSTASGIPLEFGFIRNHYVGRTFIQPKQVERDFSIRLKVNVVKEVVEGKRVIIVDDSMIRGTTSRDRIKYLRRAGAKEVHLRISCPPHRFPCYFGIDFPTRAELIAANNTIEEIRESLQLDSLGFLSEASLRKSVSKPDDYCTACFDGNYPIPVPSELDKYAHEIT